MIVVGNVIGNVVAPLIVAALGNRNDIVFVIDAVDGAHNLDNKQPADGGGARTDRGDAGSAERSLLSTAWITNTVSFRFPSAATIRGTITFPNTITIAITAT